MIRIDVKLLCIVGLLTASSSALARYFPDDSQSVDSEERLTTEAFIDFPSYRPRPSWQAAVDESDNALRLSAGSLTMTRFFYEAQIRFASPMDRRFAVAYSQEKTQTTATADVDQEVRLQTNLGIDGARGWHLAGLGDSDTFKQYGDLGVALGTHAERHRFAEAYAWSVDHYFNSKGPVTARYTRRPVAIGARGQQDLPAIAGKESTVLWNIRWDTPLTLRDRDAMIEYHHARRVADVAWTFRLDPARRLKWHGIHETKDESREALGEITQFKSLRRQTDSDEISLANIETDTETGIVHALHVANYDQRRPPRGVSPIDDFERSIRRQEITAFHFADVARWSDGHRIRLGALGSAGRVATRDRDPWMNFHAKIHTGWEYRISPGSAFSASCNWDADHIVTDCLRGMACRPWDGGNLQFMVVL